MKRVSVAEKIMAGFARRTGLEPSRTPTRRYLWTDAFAVCNYLGLYRQTNNKEHLRAAQNLVEQVHAVLGRHRADDSRTGLISGLTEQEGGVHPTRGGLRIGKGRMERRPEEAIDERLEWDRDGQYFHYLVKWMHALDCVARTTGESRYAEWAVELAKVAHASFVHASPPANRKRIYWKMSIDLTYPLVAAMGQHDPLDGLVTCEQLMATASRFDDFPAALDLSREISDFREICGDSSWVTDDALGIGGLLSDALRLTQLIVAAGLPETDRLVSLLRDAGPGLTAFARQAELDRPADYRLAFRELGLSIGLHAIERMRQICTRPAPGSSWPPAFESGLSELSRFVPLSRRIEGFWLDSDHRGGRGWQDHRDINEVMLATSLSPDGYLMLR